MMADKEDAEVLKALLPVVGISTAVVVGFAVLVQSFALGQRVYYRDGQYLISVRYPGQLNDLRQFITPNDPAVQALYSQIGSSVNGCLQWVCSQIDYRRDWGEFFQFPAETIATRRGDCEDSANLLTSLLIAAGMPAYTVLGNYQGYGHAWCQYNRQVIETTYSSARPVPDPTVYAPMVMFNDVEVHELYQGALEAVFHLTHDEATKLNLMARTLEAIA